MHLVLFDDNRYNNFLPLTHTRPVSELRCGIFTMREKWEQTLQLSVAYHTVAHLQEKFSFAFGDDNLLINSALFPEENITIAIQQLELGECIIQDSIVLAARIAAQEASTFSVEQCLSTLKQIEFNLPIKQLYKLWDLFQLNDYAILADYNRVTKNRISSPIADSNKVIGSQLFIEEGAKVTCSILNTETGPIYIGKDAEVMEGCIIRGPIALGKNAVLKMGAKIYGATTIGDGCKVGGEVNNSIFFANSSKAHDGFIGNSVIGEFCNMGADTNNSNLKNNYEEVKLWSEPLQRFEKTGLQFCGLIMGDHSKCGINTMFNTGTVIGVSCNIFGAGFPRNFIPSFTWGGPTGITEYQLAKALTTASAVFARRNLLLEDVDQKLLSAVFEITKVQRSALQ